MPHSWSLSGDLNATVSALERLTSEDWRPFLLFLEDCNTIDIWSRAPTSGPAVQRRMARGMQRRVTLLIG